MQSALQLSQSIENGSFPVFVVHTDDDLPDLISLLTTVLLMSIHQITELNPVTLVREHSGRTSNIMKKIKTWKPVQHP